MARPWVLPFDHARCPTSDFVSEYFKIHVFTNLSLQFKTFNLCPQQHNVIVT